MRKAIVRTAIVALLSGYVFWAYNTSTGGLYQEPEQGGFAFQGDCNKAMNSAATAALPTPVASPSPAPTPLMQFFGCYLLQQ